MRYLYQISVKKGVINLPCYVSGKFLYSDSEMTELEVLENFNKENGYNLSLSDVVIRLV